MSQAPTQSPIEEVVAFLSRGPTQQEIATFSLSDGAQERLRELLRRNSTGELTPDEAQQLDEMVLLDDIVALIRVRAQSELRP